MDEEVREKYEMDGTYIRIGSYKNNHHQLEFIRILVRQHMIPISVHISQN